jgi:hypothetical protein
LAEFCRESDMRQGLGYALSFSRRLHLSRLVMVVAIRMFLKDQRDIEVAVETGSAALRFARHLASGGEFVQKWGGFGWSACNFLQHLWHLLSGTSGVLHS